MQAPQACVPTSCCNLLDMLARGLTDRRAGGLLYWGIIAIGVTLPLAIAATSPLLAWRSLIYIAAGFAGIAGLAVLLVQPLLAANLLAGIGPRTSRRLHAVLGGALVALVVAHVLGLWITSPPDVIDALLFRSPTTFSLWGVVAMWAVFAAALVALLRRRLAIAPVVWRRIHASVAVVAVIGTIVHAVLIDGTMGTISKIGLCALVGLVALRSIIHLRMRGR